jgi:hypothetical protein
MKPYVSALSARKIHLRAFRRQVLLDCQVVRERDFRLVSSLAFDLSTDGALVLTGDRVLTGEPLLVSFRPPNGGAWLDLEATVARVIHGRRDGDRGRCLGLSFHSVGESDYYRLFEGIRGLPPASSAFERS